jgi:ADP-ribose pyrophosphatase YjhB (NUDIX family)
LFVEAARRVLKSTTGLNDIYLEEVAVFDKLDRFPPWRVFTVGCFALVKITDYDIISSSLDSTEVKWFSVNKLPELDWDYKDITHAVMKKLRSSIVLRPIGLNS